MKKELKHYVKMGGFCNISDQKCDNLGAREMKKTGCIKKTWIACRSKETCGMDVGYNEDNMLGNNIVFRFQQMD